MTASFFSALDLKKTLKILILFKEEGASKFGRICFFLSTSFFIIIILNATMPSKNNLKSEIIKSIKNNVISLIYIYYFIAFKEFSV